MTRARDIANLGTQAGSGLDASDITTGVLPVGVTGGAGLTLIPQNVVKLYTTLDPNATSVDMNGFFDDSVYAYYKLVVTNMHCSVSNGTPILKVMTAGSVDTGSHFWTSTTDTYGNAGSVTEQNRADNDGANFAYMNATWDLPNVASRQSNFEITFADPQNAVTNKLFRTVYWGDSHGASTIYYVGGTGMIEWHETTALTGISFQTNNGNLEDGRVTLYGYKF